jgi:L-ascorbate metabolism protein UlaG (beta-lactamase superfamily)
MLPLVLALLTQAPDSGLSVRFIGNEAFEISDGGHTIVTDFPYRSGAFGYMTYEPQSGFSGEVLALVTHGHLDHFDPAQWRDSSWFILGPRAVTLTLPFGRRLTLDSVVTFGRFVIRPRVTPHADQEHYSYLVDWGPLRLYFAGDTEDPSFLRAASGVTHAFLTPWLWTTVNQDPAGLPDAEIIFYHHIAGQRLPPCQACWLPRQGETRRLTAP